MEIRKATVKDFSSFYKIFAKSLRKQFCHYTPATIDFYLEKDFPESWLRPQIEQGSRLIYLATDKHKIVGYLLVNKPYGGISFATWLAVISEYQGKGIGSKLLTFWEKDALNMGAHALQLSTTKNNVDFYKHRGFSLVGMFPDSWFGVDSYAFYKHLKPAKEENYLRDYLAKKKA